MSSQQIATALNTLANSDQPGRIYYGSPVTGICYIEDKKVLGKVIKLSDGWALKCFGQQHRLMPDKIIGVQLTKAHKDCNGNKYYPWLYRHPFFTIPELKVVTIRKKVEAVGKDSGKKYKYEVTDGLRSVMYKDTRGIWVGTGQEFDTITKAVNWLNFMKGLRMRKN